MKRLGKSRKNAVISGVCGGIAEYFNIDPLLVRIIWVLSGIGLIVYILCAVLLPYNDEPMPPQNDYVNHNYDDSDRRN